MTQNPLKAAREADRVATPNPKIITLGPDELQRNEPFLHIKVLANPAAQAKR
jgi:hypothetical protein